MNSEFDNQASKILRENIDDISAERWSDEWDTTEFSPQLKQAITEFENELTTEGGIDVIGLKDIVDEIHGANVLDDDVKEQAIGYLRQRAEAAGLEEFDLYGEEGIFSDIDGEIDEEGKRFRLVGVGGYHSQTENVEGEFNTVDEVIDHIEPQYLRGNKNNPAYQNRLKVISKLRKEIKDPSNWSSEGFEDNLLRFGIGEIYEVVDLDGEVDEFNREENRRDLAKPIHSWMRGE